MGILAGWRYCPRCSTELEPAPDHLACPACGGQYWGSSVPGAQGILEREGCVLLVRRGRDPRQGYWDLPGGFLDEGETPAAGLRREFLEETGLEIEPVELLRIDIEPYADRYVFSVSWLVRDMDPTRAPKPADDVDQVRWFARDELPGEMAFPGQDSLLREWAGRSAGPSR